MGTVPAENACAMVSGSPRGNYNDNAEPSSHGPAKGRFGLHHNLNVYSKPDKGCLFDVFFFMAV